MYIIFLNLSEKQSGGGVKFKKKRTSDMGFNGTSIKETKKRRLLSKQLDTWEAT